MSLQTTVNIEQGFGVIGAFYDSSPRRVNAMIVSGGADVAATYATGTVTNSTGIPTANDTVTIGGRVYTFKSTLAAAYDVKIGADIAATMTSFGLAVNGTGVAGTDYYAGTLANLNVTASAPVAGVVTLTAINSGTAGNGVLLSKSGTNLAVSGVALTGGAAAVNVDAVIGRAFIVDASNRKLATVGGTGTFAGVLVNPKTQTHSGLDATLVVADGQVGDICSMGHIVVQPANNVTVGMSAYYANTTGTISGFTGTGAQSGYTLIAGSQFIRVDSTASTGLAVLSLTNA